jgi:hypothetical protein
MEHAMSQKHASKVDYSDIPHDFPQPVPLKVSPHGPMGVHISMYERKCYNAGGSPPEIWELWQVCAELVEYFKKTCLDEKALHSPLLEPAEIIDFYFSSTLNDLGWGTEAEVKWIFRHVADELAWPVPEGATG